MKNEMKIETPILVNITTAGAKLVSTMPGWIDPGEVCGVLSGLESITRVQPKDGGKAFSGSELTTLITRGGQKIMVMGKVEEVHARLRQALGLKVEQPEAPMAAV